MPSRRRPPWAKRRSSSCPAVNVRVEYPVRAVVDGVRVVSGPPRSSRSRVFQAAQTRRITSRGSVEPTAPWPAAVQAGVLAERGAQPGADRRPESCGGRRGVAHELLDGGGDRGGLLGRGRCLADLDPGPGRGLPAIARHMDTVPFSRARDLGLRPRHGVPGGGPRSRRSTASATVFVESRAASGLCHRRSTSTRHPTATSGRCPRAGSCVAILKWVTSFPNNPAARAAGGDGCDLRVERRGRRAPGAGGCALGHRPADRSRRGRGRAGARPGGRLGPWGSWGCGLHGAWAARCLAAAEYGPGVRDASTPTPRWRGELAGELDWEAGSREDALGVRRGHLRHPRRRARVKRLGPAPGAPSELPGRGRPRERPRPRSTQWPAASCSATSGSRRATAAS